MEELEKMEDLPADAKKQSRSMLEYARLRFQSYQLYLKHAQGDSIDMEVLAGMNSRMDEIITRMNE